MDVVAHKRSPHITWHPTNYGCGVCDVPDGDMAGGSRETRGRGSEGSRVPRRPKSCKGKGMRWQGREGRREEELIPTDVTVPSTSSLLVFTFTLKSSFTFNLTRSDSMCASVSDMQTLAQRKKECHKTGVHWCLHTKIKCTPVLHDSCTGEQPREEYTSFHNPGICCTMYSLPLFVGYPCYTHNLLPEVNWSAGRFMFIRNLVGGT